MSKQKILLCFFLFYLFSCDSLFNSSTEEITDDPNIEPENEYSLTINGTLGSSLYSSGRYIVFCK